MMTVPNLKYIAVYELLSLSTCFFYCSIFIIFKSILWVVHLYKTSNIENVVNQLCSSSEMWLAVEWNVTLSLSLSVKKTVFDCIALALVLVESVLDPQSVQGPPGLSLQLDCISWASQTSLTQRRGDFIFSYEIFLYFLMKYFYIFWWNIFSSLSSVWLKNT